jgi:hypothetical protein
VNQQNVWEPVTNWFPHNRFPHKLRIAISLPFLFFIKADMIILIYNSLIDDTPNFKEENMKKKLIAVTLINVSVMGCATLSKDECLQGDWKSIGYRDGTHGYDLTRFEQHQKACADYHVSPDINAYQAGREEGLVVYCTPQNGFNLGEQIEYYSGICPPYLETAFLEQYEQGLQSAYRANEQKLEDQEDGWRDKAELLFHLENQDKINQVKKDMQQIDSEVERLRDKKREITRLLDKVNSLKQ